MLSSSLINKIDTNSEIIGIIGLGYVGLPLAVSFAQAGVKVIGFDKSQSKVDKINRGDNYIKDIRDAVLREVVENITLTATSDFTRIQECDALLICVHTPLDKFRKPDMSFIESACIAIGKNMKPGTFISLESTTYPTTTEEFMLPILERESGLKHGVDFWMAYSPERVDPENASFHTKNTPKVQGAIDATGLEIGQSIYSKAIDHLRLVSSPNVADMVKIQPIINALNSHKKSVKCSKILFVGVSNKMDKAQESTTLGIMDIIAKEGGEVSYYDPHIPEVATPSGRMFQSVKHDVLSSSKDSELLPFIPSILQSSGPSILLFMLAADCVVFTTNYSTYDYEIIKRHSKLIVDLRE